MHRIAKFHFVSPGQFLTAMQEGYPQYTEAQIKEKYENLGGLGITDLSEKRTGL